MRRLLDTHIALWAVTLDPRLPAEAADVIADRAIEVCVSAASLWEIAIKNALPTHRQGGMPCSAAEAADLFTRTQFQILPITEAHAVAVEALDATHKDPFDRLLVAQAISESMLLLTHDRRLAAYSDLVQVI